MPILRQPTTEELEDHLFGSGAFIYGWFNTKSSHFPADIDEIDFDGEIFSTTQISEDEFIRGMMMYANGLEDRTFDDLVEDMDSVDVDNVIQLAIFGEIRYS